MHIQSGNTGKQELKDFLDTLPDGEYYYLFLDESANRSLPQLKYLFGVVLKTISKQLPGNPPIDGLYRYFEELYAPLKTCQIQGLKYQYSDLKNERAIEVNDTIGKIIHHAAKEWGIVIPTKEDMMQAEARGLYAEAYSNEWRYILSPKRDE